MEEKNILLISRRLAYHAHAAYVFQLLDEYSSQQRVGLNVKVLHLEIKSALIVFSCDAEAALQVALAWAGQELQLCSNWRACTLLSSKVLIESCKNLLCKAGFPCSVVAVAKGKTL